MIELSKESIEFITKNSVRSVLIIVGAVLLRILIGVVINKLIKRLEDDDPTTTNALEQRSQTLGSLAKNISNVVIYAIAFIMILSEWGLNIAPILTGAGILGLAVGFGTQKLVQDMVTGFFILFENQYNVGDRVQIGGQEGIVRDLKIRTTVLEGDDGTIYMIPNSNISIITKINDKND